MCRSADNKAVSGCSFDDKNAQTLTRTWPLVCRDQKMTRASARAQNSLQTILCKTQARAQYLLGVLLEQAREASAGAAASARTRAAASATERRESAAAEAAAQTAAAAAPHRGDIEAAIVVVVHDFA
jgi:hypothetical protein